MKKQNRRKFIRDIGIGGLVTTTAPAVLLAKDRLMKPPPIKTQPAIQVKAEIIRVPIQDLT